MKTTPLSLCLLLLLQVSILAGCSKSESEPAVGTLSLPKTTFEQIDAQGATLTIDIESNKSWHATSNSAWCVPEQTSGKKNARLRVTLAPNAEAYARAATLTVTVDNLKEQVLIVQNGQQLTDHTLSDHSYRLPIVFQVLYKDSKDAKQHVAQNRLRDLVAACNKYYNNRLGANSIDMNLEFVLATHDPDGNELPEPGIRRIEVPQPELDCEEFMKEKKNLEYLWDTDRYINILLYTFTNKQILGISHLPYTIGSDQLPGLGHLSFLPTHESLTYPHCISVNNAYINESASIEPTSYNSQDPVATLAHELGHYLGLLHSFNEKEDGKGNLSTDLCEDTDHCADTPPYNRTTYLADFDVYLQKHGGHVRWEDMPTLLQRTNCQTNEVSTPNNVMDYMISYANRFTSDQRERIRHVLTHSPLIPGPKVTRATTRATTAPHPFPVKTMKCALPHTYAQSCCAHHVR